MIPEGASTVPLVDHDVSISSASSSDDYSEDGLPKKRHYVGLPLDLLKRGTLQIRREDLQPLEPEPDQSPPEAPKKVWWQRLCPRLSDNTANPSMAIKHSSLRDMNLYVSGKKPKGKSDLCNMLTQ